MFDRMLNSYYLPLASASVPVKDPIKYPICSRCVEKSYSMKCGLATKEIGKWRTVSTSSQKHVL